MTTIKLNEIDINDIENEQTPFVEPYRRHLAEFQSLGIEEIIPVNVDIATVVTTVLGALPEILSLSAEISDQLPRFDFERVKNLESYAIALSHANTLYLYATQPADSLDPLLEEGNKLRDTLLADANALILRGLLNGNHLKDLKGVIGYKNLAVDLQILTTLFRENFAQIEGKCATTRAELSRAEVVAHGVLRAVGLREQGTALIAETTDVRARALTKLMQVYDSARRAVTYLRWAENDVDTIAPSLYAGRGTGRKKAATDIKDPPKPPPTGSPSTGGVVPPSPSVPGTSARSPQQPVSTPAVLGDDPFLS